MSMGLGIGVQQQTRHPPTYDSQQALSRPDFIRRAFSLCHKPPAAGWGVHVTSTMLWLAASCFLRRHPHTQTLHLCNLNSLRIPVVYDINGREAAEAKPVLEGCGRTLEQYIYCSSAGVYLKSDQMPHRETDAVDPKSRHKVCGGCGGVWRLVRDCSAFESWRETQGIRRGHQRS